MQARSSLYGSKYKRCSKVCFTCRYKSVTASKTHIRLLTRVGDCQIHIDCRHWSQKLYSRILHTKFIPLHETRNARYYCYLLPRQRAMPLLSQSLMPRVQQPVLLPIIMLPVPLTLPGTLLLVKPVLLPKHLLLQRELASHGRLLLLQ